MSTSSSTVPLSGSAPERAAVLMIEVQRGDDTAFRDLYDLTHVRIGLVIARIVRAPEHSAEVMQEVFLYAWEHAQVYDASRGPVLGWLAMVARRRAVDRVRSVVRSAARDQRDHTAVSRVVPDIADAGVARVEALHLRTAVHQLSVRQRDAVALTYLYGYSNQEAAELLSVPLGTLKSRVRAGLANLRVLVEPLAA